MTQGFLKLVGNTKPATIINVSSVAAISAIPSTGSYSLSKLVQIQMQRYISIENPNVVAVSLHPGTVVTGMTLEGFKRFTRDTFALAGGVAVWLATEQAKFMNGRFMGVNWDVTEMEERKESIIEKDELVMKLAGTLAQEQFEA